MPSAMRVVDEAAEIVGRAVERDRGEQADAVVAPAEAAGKIGDRHDFDHGDADGGELGQFAGARRPTCLRG